ncbi:MAG: hypothetical protein K940chlam9_01857, partial [Chlamydiae bacterium]|nr:hypothetical protein [Chlamydiota bacterium]
MFSVRGQPNTQWVFDFPKPNAYQVIGTILSLFMICMGIYGSILNSSMWGGYALIGIGVILLNGALFGQRIAK